MNLLIIPVVAGLTCIGAALYLFLRLRAASLAALFAHIGGGIYTKAADIGADLVGKIEANIPEDDPRNPAVVADLVGDNVGDCAGRGADLFQTFSDDIVTGMVVALTLVPKYGGAVLFFPMLLQSAGLAASMLGVLSIRLFDRSKPETAFYWGMAVTARFSRQYHEGDDQGLCHVIRHSDFICPVLDVLLHCRSQDDERDGALLHCIYPPRHLPSVPHQFTDHRLGSQDGNAHG